MNQHAIRELAASIDHTLLRADATLGQVQRLCQEARQWGFCAVCVNPLWVKVAVQALAGSPVKVATVVGFPLGATTARVKLVEAQEALAAGAAELDVVVSLGRLKGGEETAFVQELAEVVELATGWGATVKAILETCLLSEEEKTRAAQWAVAAGVHFLKTSTGFGSGGATVEDVALLRKLAPPSVGIKASGGIRTLAQARAMLAAGASRLGTSASVAIMEEAVSWYGS
ncbi:MAG: deoxyribose-phosphate aldolase [Thermoanaerobaculum sp.]|nr:deoxyribose-phosphate aldolase [Thermoanaerobaculum sp.]MDW7966775.1 deoxyribose-phosphate aldolase [Thermoanaerobaculum sp.]